MCGNLWGDGGTIKTVKINVENLKAKVREEKYKVKIYISSIKINVGNKGVNIGVLLEAGKIIFCGQGIWLSDQLTPRDFGFNIPYFWLLFSFEVMFSGGVGEFTKGSQYFLNVKYI
jgi:hypothetical protein